MVLCGHGWAHKRRCTNVESEAQELTKTKFWVRSLTPKEMQSAIFCDTEFAAEAGKPRWAWEAETENASLTDALATGYADQGPQNLWHHENAALR